MDETEEKSIRPLRFGVARRKRNFHGCIPLVKVVLQAYHGFRARSSAKPIQNAPLLFDFARPSAASSANSPAFTLPARRSLAFR
jgi:hypothetical protein